LNLITSFSPFIDYEECAVFRLSGMTSEDYTAVRCGMNVSKGIIEGTIDAGIGLENIQQVEVSGLFHGLAQCLLLVKKSRFYREI
jgi:hypothetical protein